MWSFQLFNLTNLAIEQNYENLLHANRKILQMDWSDYTIFSHTVYSLQQSTNLAAAFAVQMFKSPFII